MFSSKQPLRSYELLDLSIHTCNLLNANNDATEKVIIAVDEVPEKIAIILNENDEFDFTSQEKSNFFTQLLESDDDADEKEENIEMKFKLSMMRAATKKRIFDKEQLEDEEKAYSEEAKPATQDQKEAQPERKEEEEEVDDETYVRKWLYKKNFLNKTFQRFDEVEFPCIITKKRKITIYQ